MSRIYEQPSMTPDDTAVFAIEKGADNNWTTYKTTWGSLKTLLSAATDIQYNAETGVFTFTKTDGNVITITPHDPTKVDKVAGKGLSENDFTNTLKTKLDNIAAGAEANVQSDWNQTNNEADDYIKNKPTIPTVDAALDATSENAIQNKAVKEALDDKVDAVEGKGLSTEDYTAAEKTKLAGVEAGANNYVLPPATASTLGGVKPGINMSVDANGVLSMASTDIVSATEAWLDDHIDPTTGYAVDNTLEVAGAAADAKTAGDKISEIKSALLDDEFVFDSYEFSANRYNIASTENEQSIRLTATGEEVSSDNYDTTHFIFVEDASRASLQTNRNTSVTDRILSGARSVVFYDKFKNVIGGLENPETVIDVSNAYYIRMSISKSLNTLTKNPLIGIKDTVVAYEEYSIKKIVNPDVYLKKSQIENFVVTDSDLSDIHKSSIVDFSVSLDEIDGCKIQYGKNLFNPNDFVDGSFDSHGVETTSSNYVRCNSKIAVETDKSYVMQGYNGITTVLVGMRWVIEYDANGDFVDAKENIDSYVVPSGVSSVRIAVPILYKNVSNCPMFFNGTGLSVYEPFTQTEYLDYPVKLENAVDYSEVNKKLENALYSLRNIDSVCNHYSCAAPSVEYTGHSTVDVIYNMYDALISAFPNYVSKTLLGTIEEYNYPIYRYDFVPVKPQDKALCKILYCTGTHGGEWPNILTGVRFFNDLCYNWKTSDLLKEIRSSCHITVIPLVNPYGFVSGQRKNENGVDVNRNFTKGWHVITDDPTAQNYQGPYAASEKSTQIIEALCASEHFDFGIDHHIYGSFSASDKVGYFVNSSEKPAVVAFSFMYGLWANAKTMSENTLIVDDSKVYFTITTQPDFGGYEFGTFENGVLWESMTEWGDSEMEEQIDSQKFNVECLGCLIYSAKKSFFVYST